ncbi:MAG: molybdopterin-dependent oxidoreductase [Candidatus Atribacteria bacterium]|nr:molybdopterin-dependent oxidoreductase [Candidatus Atribacteria bacterium]
MKIIEFLLIIFLVFLLGQYFITVPSWASESTPSPEPTAQVVEIREYQGEKLGSVNDFRENSIQGIQNVDVSSYRLVVDGLVEKPLTLSYDELKGYPHQKKLHPILCVEGWDVTALWEGIPLLDLFKNTTPKGEANTVIFHSTDGYTTSLSLDYLREKNIIIADHINGLVLPPAQGFPFMLVAEDKWGYKWARWINRIELSNDPNYRGYWEKRGYSNKGDTQGSMLGE